MSIVTTILQWDNFCCKKPYCHEKIIDVTIIIAISFADTIFVFCHIIIVVAIELLQRMIGDAIEHIGTKDGHCIKC
jgi:hypothetical protein